MKIKLFLFLSVLVFISCKNETKIVVPTSSLSTFEETPLSAKKHYHVEEIGDTLDVFNGVYVFYNKSMNNTSGRNVTGDGYNLGLKWQCVEFVKRYYYLQLSHKMPNSYGHAKDFFNTKIEDGALNTDRNLIQFINGSKSKPEVSDLLIFDGNLFNPYGHVAIISEVNENEIEIVQQNVGKNPRDHLPLNFHNDVWSIRQSDVLGWLRIK